MTASHQGHSANADAHAGDPRLLLASIHDVGPHFDSEISLLADRFERELGQPRFAMLVVPDHWGRAPLTQDKGFQAKLRAWTERGVEMFVHGWYHRDYARHSGLARFKARHMTAGEGEFLGLDSHEAARRMADGRALIEDVTGRSVAGFVAPAWLYGHGAMHALTASGFALAEDHWRVWRPATQEVVARGPVITWASRSRGRQASSLAVATLARALLHRQRVVRVAAHPGDTCVPRLMDSIAATLASFAARRRVAAYCELIA